MLLPLGDEAFTLQSGQADLIGSKMLLDWVVRYSLRTILGGSEVNSWGGYTKFKLVRLHWIHRVVRRCRPERRRHGEPY